MLKQTTETNTKGVKLATNATGKIKYECVRFGLFGRTGRVFSDKMPIACLSEERKKAVLLALEEDNKFIKMRSDMQFDGKDKLWLMYSGPKAVQGLSIIKVVNKHLAPFPPTTWARKMAEEKTKGNICEIRSQDISIDTEIQA